MARKCQVSGCHHNLWHGDIHCTAIALIVLKQNNDAYCSIINWLTQPTLFNKSFWSLPLWLVLFLVVIVDPPWWANMLSPYGTVFLIVNTPLALWSLMMVVMWPWLRVMWSALFVMRLTLGVIWWAVNMITSPRMDSRVGRDMTSTVCRRYWRILRRITNIWSMLTWGL